jgi:hypothetical protein
MEELRLSRLNQNGYGSLCGLGHRSVIPYVHKEDCCTAVYGDVQALSTTCIELMLSNIGACSVLL